MRYLLLSDLHANAVALGAVLHHAATQRWEQVVFLGDAVGYYPQPEEVICTLSSLPLKAALLGNHDAALLHLAAQHASPRTSPRTSPQRPQTNAPKRTLHTRSLVTEVLERQRPTLSKSAFSFLASLRPHVLADGWEAVHGALSEPWGYLNTPLRAHAELSLLARPLLFFGHTHLPSIFAFTEHGGKTLTRSVALGETHTVYRLPPNAAVLVNPGSVGQPRDGVPLASYMVFDDEARVLEHHRVAFDIERVQRSVRAAGYPAALGARLARGR